MGYSCFGVGTLEVAVGGNCCQKEVLRVAFIWLWVKNQWYHFGVGAPPILVYFSGDWDVHWGYNLDFEPWSFDSYARREFVLKLDLVSE